MQCMFLLHMIHQLAQGHASWTLEIHDMIGTYMLGTTRSPIKLQTAMYTMCGPGGLSKFGLEVTTLWALILLDYWPLLPSDDIYNGDLETFTKSRPSIYNVIGRPMLIVVSRSFFWCLSRMIRIQTFMAPCKLIGHHWEPTLYQALKAPLPHSFYAEFTQDSKYATKSALCWILRDIFEICGPYPPSKYTNVSCFALAGI
jgi:hypothetical protein